MSVDMRLQEILDRHELPASAKPSLSALLDRLQSDPTAPTTVRSAGEGVDVHIADSLVALELDAVRQARRVADLGAGAGLPGLPLAVALPEARVTLVESVGRKVAFLNATIEAMGLGNADAVAERAETWQEGMGACDLVTARALAPLTAIVEYAAPLLAADGALVAWKGRRDPAEEADGEAAAAATGLELAGIRPVSPFKAADHRHLYLYLKVGSTPNQYPRRPGMARKRPIQAST